jgi:hypothetical protein
MNIDIEITETELKQMIYKYFQEKLGTINVNPDDIKIEVKTTQNYRAKEWESGAFRARVKKWISGNE